MPNEDDSLRTRYLRRFFFGWGLLALLAVPAIVHSHAAIESLLNTPPDWVPDSLPEKAQFNEFLRHFSVGDVILCAWPEAQLDSESLNKVSQAIAPLCEQSYKASTDAESLSRLSPKSKLLVDQIREASKTSTPFPWARSGTETLENMMAAPASLSRRTAIARLSGSLVGPDGKQTCIVIAFGEQGTVHRRKVIPLLRELIAEAGSVGESTLSMVGGPYDGATVDDESVRSIRTFSPPSAIIAAILCFLCLRSIWLTLVITVIAVTGEGMVLAAVYYTGTPMNAVLIVLPPLVFVLTVSGGIHLSNYYLDAVHEFVDMTPAKAARQALKAGAAPCLLATGTTVVGLGSLMLVRLEPIRIFGFVASLGVMSTLGMLLLMLPGAMVLTQPKRTDESDLAAAEIGPVRKYFRTKMRARLARPWPMIVFFMCLTAVLATGLTKLETSVSVPRMFRPESPIRTQYAWFEENIGPTVTGDVLLKLPLADAGDDPLERLELVKRAHLRAHNMEGVGGVLSAMSFVSKIPKRRSLGATVSRSAIRSLISDPDSSLGKLDFISRDQESEVWRISLRMPQTADTSFSERISSIKAEITDELSGSEIPVEIIMTGHVAIVQKAQQVLLRDLFRSFLAAFAIVAIVMILVLRSIVGGILAMVPNLFPTVAAFGIMGLSRSPLDIGSVMTASVALGIAVDDTVHLLSRYGSRRARGFGQIRASFGALGQCGWAMFQTTTVCGLSLMAYWFSDFVPTSRFALLMFALLFAALFGDVLLLPGMMASSLGRWLARSVGVNPHATISSDQPAVKSKATPKDSRSV